MDDLPEQEPCPEARPSPADCGWSSVASTFGWRRARLRVGVVVVGGWEHMELSDVLISHRQGDLNTADYMFGCRQTAYSVALRTGKKHGVFRGKIRCVIVLSEFLIFSTEPGVQTIIKNTTTLYTKPTHTSLPRLSPSSSQPGLLPPNQHPQPDKEAALSCTHWCTCLERSKGPHARHFIMVFSLLLLRVTKHI